MSAEEPATEGLTPTPDETPTPLRLVLTDTGGVATIGRADFVPDPGQRVIDLPDEHYAAFVEVAASLGVDDEIAYDEHAGGFSRRARVRSPEEQAEAADQGARAARLARLDQDIAGYDALTAQERAAAQRNTMVLVRGIARKLLGE